MMIFTFMSELAVKCATVVVDGFRRSLYENDGRALRTFCQTRHLNKHTRNYSIVCSIIKRLDYSFIYTSFR